MSQEINEENWKQRMHELEEKSLYYKLKRREKNELKALHRKSNSILNEENKKLEEERKKKEEEERKKKEEEERKKKEEEERKKKEEEERKKKVMKKQKEEIMARQKEYRKAQFNTIMKKKSEKVEDILEDMCILGSIMKEEIIEEKKNNPEKFITIEEATKEENNNSQTFCLGVLAQSLENIGITTAIEKNSSNSEESQNSSNTVLQFITNGMIEKKKYDLHFDLGDERNNELLNNKQEQKKFNNKLRKKLSIEYNIPEDKIIITNPQKGSYSVQVIFATDNFNDKYVDINTLKNNCNDEEFKELKNLKEIHSTLIMDGCKLSPDMLDSRGNRESGWGENEKRGGFDYYPPKGWKGFGLKVLGKYDNGNDDWITYNGNPNEWAIAYHGIGVGGNCKTVEQATENIYKGGFKAGGGQAKKNDKNINKRYKPDPNYPQDDHSKTVGIGVYCSPKPEVMASYASTHSTTKINGKNFQMGFMMRVKPDKIRISESTPDYWVLNGTTDEMRPYRIMIK